MVDIVCRSNMFPFPTKKPNALKIYAQLPSEFYFSFLTWYQICSFMCEVVISYLFSFWPFLPLKNNRASRIERKIWRDCDVFLLLIFKRLLDRGQARLERLGIISFLTFDLRPKLFECMFIKIHIFQASYGVWTITLNVICGYKWVFAYVFHSWHQIYLRTLHLTYGALLLFHFCCCIKIPWQSQPRGGRVYFKSSVSSKSPSLQELEVANHIHNLKQRENQHTHSYAQLTFSSVTKFRISLPRD